MLKIIFDTNTLISAIGWAGLPYQALIKALKSPDIEVFITQTIYDELEENFKKEKLKKYYPYYKNFKNNILDEFRILEDSSIKVFDEELLPESNDRIIYRTAVANELDILVTGDSHFINSGISGTKVLKAKEFVELIQNKTN